MGADGIVERGHANERRPRATEEYVDLLTTISFNASSTLRHGENSLLSHFGTSTSVTSSSVAIPSASSKGNVRPG